MSNTAFGDMYCPTCGRVYPDGTKKCPKCIAARGAASLGSDWYCPRCGRDTGGPGPCPSCNSGRAEYASRGRGYRGPAIPLSEMSLQGCIFETRSAAAPLLRSTMGSLPDKVDLRQWCSPVEHQGRTNSCTANAIVAALEYHQRRSGQAQVDLSRLFVYYNARKMAGTEGDDHGSQIHHVMASVLAHGACEEAIWPFEPDNIPVAPPGNAYQNGSVHEAVSYARAPLGVSAMQALAAGLPVVFGTFVPGHFYQVAETTGLMPMPEEKSEQPAMGHAMLIVGYDNTEKTWLVRNSYGEAFGDKGYMRIPFATLQAYSPPEAFWVVGAIEAAPGLSVVGASVKDAVRETRAEAREDMRAAMARMAVQRNTTPKSGPRDHRSTSMQTAARPMFGCLFEPRPAAAPLLRAAIGSVPDKVDLRQWCSPIEDQGNTNSCTANAIVGALEYHQKRSGKGGPDLSRMFVYYNARQLAGKQDEDSGSLIHHVMAAVLAHGACDEAIWPFDKAATFRKPSDPAYRDAEKHGGVSYARAPLGASAIQAVSMGLPVVFGTYIPQEYYKAADGNKGVMPAPQGQITNPGGGHAMLIVGYDLPQKMWIVRNSWGTGFGDQGYYYIPFAMLEACSPPDAFWVIGAIQQAQGAQLLGASVGDALKETQNNARAEMDEAMRKLQASGKNGPYGEKKCFRCGAIYLDDSLVDCPACKTWMNVAPDQRNRGKDTTTYYYKCLACYEVQMFEQEGAGPPNIDHCRKCGSRNFEVIAVVGPGPGARSAASGDEQIATYQCLKCFKEFKYKPSEKPTLCPDDSGVLKYIGVEASQSSGDEKISTYQCNKCFREFRFRPSEKPYLCPEGDWGKLTWIGGASVPAAARGYSGAPLPTSARRLDGCLLEKRAASSPVLRAPMGSTPEKVDLRQWCSPVEDQGQTSSCTANATVGAMEYHQRKAGGAVIDISRLFVYYNARKMADAQAEDCGSFIHHAMAAVLAYGACEEDIWPFDLGQVLAMPSQQAYQNAQSHEAVQYARSPLGQSALQAVAAGLPVVFGAYIPSRFFDEAAKTGLMPAPAEKQEPPASGHAMLIVGYDLPSRTWLVRNSWGANWGDKGYMRVPFATLEAYSSPDHFWAIGAIESTQGMSLSGPSPAQAAAATRASAVAEMKDALASLRGDLRSDFQAELEKQKKDIRDRLRGPGK